MSDSNADLLRKFLINQTSSGTIFVQDTEPDSPVEKDLWVDITDEDNPVFKLFNGTDWITIGASGGASEHSPTVRAFPFAFDDDGLTDGVTVYTPAVGDILLDAWFEIGTAWDGTTPTADIGTFNGATDGLFAFDPGGVDLTNADEMSDGGLLVGDASSSKVGTDLHLAGASALHTQAVVFRVAPAKFVTTDPLKVVVSQDGSSGGDDPGATHGAAILYLVTVTPATS